MKGELVGELIFVYVGNNGVADLYVEGVVERFIPGFAAVQQHELLTGYRETLSIEEGTVWLKGYTDHGFMSSRVFRLLPQGGVLTPLERWQRVNQITRETNMVKGLKITRTTHLRGSIANLERVFEWTAEGYYNCLSQDLSWEEAYKMIAASLAMQR
jgi:hypothetical protein